MDYLFEFCVTDRQREVLQAVIDNGGMRPAARALNCNAKVVDRILSTLKKRAASKGGWISGRDAKVITYSKRFGEVSRLTINPEMVSCELIAP